MWRIGLFGLATTAAIACGTSTDVSPQAIEGGGVAGGAIESMVYVHVLDDATGQPISGVSVSLGGLDERTDSEGLAVVSADSEGGQSLTVAITGYTTTTWFGVFGANVTIPMRLLTEPSLKISGSIAGWAELPDPIAGHYLIAEVEYTRRSTMQDWTNKIDQEGSGEFANDTCFDLTTPTECSFSVTTRTGPQALHALIFDGDDMGTPDDFSDDSREVIGLAFLSGLNGVGGVDQTGIELQIIPSRDLFPFQIKLPDIATQVIGVAGIEVADGVLVFNQKATKESPSVVLPKLAGAFANGNYWVIAMESGTAGSSQPRTNFERDLVDTETASIGEFLSQQSSLVRESGSVFRLGTAPGASLRRIQLWQDQSLVWEGLVLDDRMLVEVPDLPAGDYEARATAFEVEFSPMQFELTTVLESIERLSSGESSICL